MINSLSRRFSFIIIGVITIILIIFAITAIFININRAHSQLEKQLDNSLVLAQHAIALPIWNFQHDAVDDFIAALLLDQSFVYANVFSGNQIISKHNREAYSDYQYTDFQNESGRFITKSVTIVYEGDDIATIELALSRQSVEDQIVIGIAGIVGLTIAIILAVLLASLYVTRRFVSEPIQRLLTASQKMSTGGFQHRIDSISSDELGKLALGFNDMAAHLEDYSRNLELKVTQRTSELAQAMAEAEQSRQLAEQASTTKSQFLANMSHELRTPLNAIIGITEMLVEDAEETEQDDFIEPLERVKNAGNNLLHLINEILDLSKVEAGKLELTPEPFDILALVEELMYTSQALADKKDNTLHLDYITTVDKMTADPMRVRQVLLNLLGNACKFTEKGTIRLSVSDDREADLPYLQFSISDTGIGISSEQIEKLFLDFNQADSSTTRKYGGTGLGLAISQRLCTLMGGQISVDSTLGTGSVFTIRLPVTAIETTDNRERPRRSSTLSPNANITRVLAIDDDPTTRDLLRRLLAKEGFDVFTASNGKEGFKRAQELRPDLITLDVLMPELNGWEVLQQLKADSTLTDIPVILLTISDQAKKGYALGAAEYLVKPIDRKKLKDLLAAYQTYHFTPQLLIVEDDETTRQLMARTATDAGWITHETPNGKAALQQLTQLRPELIVLDLMMPEMDGFEFLDTICQDATISDIPIIIVTALDLTTAELNRLHHRVERILKKAPVSETQFVQELQQLLHHHHVTANTMMPSSSTSI